MNIPGATRPFLAIVLSLGVIIAQQASGLDRTRVYDVRDLVHLQPPLQPATAVDASQLPIANAAEEAHPAISLDELVGLLKMGTDPHYWEREGVEARGEDTGFVVLTCDEAMHTSARSVLARLRRLLFEPVLVEVHELAASSLEQQGSVLSPEAANALLAQAPAHRVYAGRTDPRTPLLLESERIQNRLAGMRMAVAQDASAPDPVLATDDNGASWTVRAARTIGDAMLVTVSGSRRALEPGPVCEVPTGADGKVAALDLPVTRLATCQASAYLHPGQAMLVGSDAPGGVVLCVRVRTGAATPLDLGAVTTYPVGHLVRSAARPAEVPVPYAEGTLFPQAQTEPAPTVLDDSRLIEWLRSQVDPGTWDGAPNSMYCGDGMLYVSAEEATQKAIVEQLQSLQLADERQYTLEVRFGKVPDQLLPTALTAPEQLAGALPCHCVSTVSASRGMWLSATSHTPYVKDYDVMLASGSGVVTPVLGSIARGFLLHGNVAPMDKGAVLLDLQMSMLMHGGERSLFSLQDPRFGQLDRIDVQQNRVRGATAVELGEWTILQLAPAENDQGHVAVVARLRAI